MPPLIWLPAALTLAALSAACEGPRSPTPAAPPPASAAATSAAATSDALVNAWSIATGTALRLTAAADKTPTPPPMTSQLQPLATADGGICDPLATVCAPTARLPTASLAAPTGTARPSASATQRLNTPRPSAPAAATATAPAAPTPVPATPSPSAMDCYNKPCIRELISPDGQNRWPETCVYLGIDTYCYITFSNGKVTAQFAWPVVWSADGQFLAIPQGGTHDSFPGGYEIWNMAKGLPTATIKYVGGWRWWSPTGHTLAHVNSLQGGGLEFRLLDAATGDDQVTRQCPTWATDQVKISDMLDWRNLCDNWVPPAGQPVILGFTVAPTEAVPGETVTLNWSSANAASAELTSYSASSAPATLTALPPNGSLKVTIGKDEKLAYSLNLIVKDQAGNTDQRFRSVSLLCPDTFYFSSSNKPIVGGCPYRPVVVVRGAQQAFEHGRMLWLAPIPAANTPSGSAEGAAVYVLYDAGVMDAWKVWQKYDDLWTAGEPESDPTLQPPAGLYQPVRGFGKIWRETPGMRDKLGWALAPEQGYNDAAYQVQWRYGNPPGDIFLRTPEKAILYLQLDGYWWSITP